MSSPVNVMSCHNIII